MLALRRHFARQLPDTTYVHLSDLTMQLKVRKVDYAQTYMLPVKLGLDGLAALDSQATPRRCLEGNIRYLSKYRMIYAWLVRHFGVWNMQ